MARQPIPIASALGFPLPGLSWSRALIVIASLMAPATAQQPEPARKPLPADAGAFVREVIGNELNAQKNDRTRWSYRLHPEAQKANQTPHAIHTTPGTTP